MATCGNADAAPRIVSGMTEPVTAEAPNRKIAEFELTAGKARRMRGCV
jgi:hypothetical protein